MEMFCKFVWKKSKILESLPGKPEIFQNFAWKNITFFVKLPEKFEISLKFAWKTWFFFTLIYDPPDFKPDWRRCMAHQKTHQQRQTSRTRQIIYLISDIWN